MTESQTWFLLALFAAWVSMWATANHFMRLASDVFVVAAMCAAGMGVWTWLT